MTSTRWAARRLGADLTQAMLYAAFAIFIVVTVLQGYKMVEIRRSKAQTTTLMTFISTEIRGLYAGAADIGSLETSHLINSGAVPLGQDRNMEGVQTIIAPYGGVVTFRAGDGPHEFRGEIDWPEGGQSPLALCLHLVGVDEQEDGGGPLGVDYVIETADCYAISPHLTALYFR